MFNKGIVKVFWLVVVTVPVKVKSASGFVRQPWRGIAMSQTAGSCSFAFLMNRRECVRGQKVISD